MRIGIVGAGWMGVQHASAFAGMDDVAIAGIAGRGRERAEALARRLGTRAVGDYRTLLDDPAVDAVDVTVPTSFHEEVCVAALDAGKHVFCETPLAHTAGAAATMASRARAVGRHLQVALLTRFARSATLLHETVDHGGLGALRALHLERFAPGTAGTHHGDVLEELLLFDLDIAVRALGLPRRVVAAAVPDVRGRLVHATALLDYGRTQATCEASYLHPRALPFTTGLHAWFDDGHLDARFDHARGAPPSIRVVRTTRGSDPELDAEPGPEPVFRECRHFVDVVEGRADPALLDAAEALLALRVLDALRASLARGTWLDFEEP
jgi:predicted dehydrogenase